MPRPPATILASLTLLLAACDAEQETPAASGHRSPGAPAPEAPAIAPLDELCRWLTAKDPYLGRDWVQQYRDELAKAERAPNDRAALADAHERLGEMLLRHGENDEAVAELQAALGLALTLDDGDHVNRTRRALGIAHMRQGEASHCIEMHNPESCLFPIRGAGVWHDPTGALLAIEQFEAILADRPDDLDVRWLLNLAYMTSGGYPDDVPATFLLPPERVASQDTTLGRFRDIAGDLGLDTDDLAGGIVLDDIDGDGLIDVFTSTMQPCQSVRYFRNQGDGTFADWTERADLSDQLGGFNCIQADYDDDGRLDLLVLRGAWMGERFGRQRNSLLHQQPDGSFVDVTFESGLGEHAYPTQVADFADYDNDGDLDLAIGNEYFPLQLFRNQGDGTFVDVAAEAGVLNENEVNERLAAGCAKSVVFGDYDNDDRADLFVSNYGEPNRLYRNRGDGTFEDVAPALGIAVEGQADVLPEERGLRPILAKNLDATRGRDMSFCSWFFDFDNDGWLDIYCGAFRSSLWDVAGDYLGQAHEGDPLRLYQNDGRGGYKEVANELGMDDARLPMGANYGDVDNDGWMDFYLGTGRPPFEYLVPNVMYRNQEGRGFVDVTERAGVGHLQKGHGVAFADVDNDGDQDLFAQMGGFYPADTFRDALFLNPGNANHWITIEARGTESNHFGVGARIEVVLETPRGTRSVHVRVDTGGSFGSSSLRQEIGLGDATRIVELRVRWPRTGQVQVFPDAPLNAFVRITEGEGELERFELPRIQLGD